MRRNVIYYNQAMEKAETRMAEGMLSRRAAEGVLEKLVYDRKRTAQRLDDPSLTLEQVQEVDEQLAAFDGAILVVLGNSSFNKVPEYLERRVDERIAAEDAEKAA